MDGSGLIFHNFSTFSFVATLVQGIRVHSRYVAGPSQGPEPHLCTPGSATSAIIIHVRERELKSPRSGLTSGQRLQRSGQVLERDKGSVENLIVIGTSAGGHRALAEILNNFSGDMPAAIVILIHMPVGPHSLKENLGRFSRLPIIEVEDQEPLQQGCIFVPPPGRSAVFSHGIITVDQGDDIPNQPKRTINALFRSAAESYGDRVIGVVLTGLLRDGTEGLRAVHEAGGLTMVQDPQEAEYPDMPANAMQALPVTFCLNVLDIGPALELLVRRTTQFETGLEVAVRTLRDRAALLVRLIEQSNRNPGTHEFLRDELASLRRDVESIDDLVKASVD